MPQPSEQRLDIEGLPVKAWGMDADRRAFILNLVASEVSYRGARLDGLTCRLAVGEIIAVQYGSQKGRFRVVWTADPAPDHPGQAGIRSLDDTCIWEAELANFPPDSSSNKSDPLAAARRDRRQFPRFRCAGTVQVGRAESAQLAWARLGDLSLGGCYVSTPVPEPVGTKLRLLIHLQETKIAAAGEVRTCVPALGMGVEFTSFEGGARDLLKQAIERLSPSKLAGRSETPAPVPPSSSMYVFLRAVRDHFESHNVLTSQEFEAILRTLERKKAPAASPVVAAPNAEPKLG